VWSYLEEGDLVLGRPITAEHRPVISYPRDTRLTRGATVPIHLVDGGLATLMAIRADAEKDFVREARRVLGEPTLLELMMHDSIYARFGEGLKRCTAVSLSDREIECLRWAARCKTAQDIAASTAVR
jgi:LuxR family transcriptional regulator, quorum-sensing system regulator SdiA